MQPPREIDELIELSCALGNDPTMVQGGGGNLSLKDGNVMWVKASGFWLAEARDRPIYVPVDLPAVGAAMAAAPKTDLQIDALDNSSLRPSIETTLHAAMRQKVVAHVHSVNSIAWSVVPERYNELENRLEGMNWAWVPYARPGVPLTMEIASRATETTDVLVLENHGIVAGGASCNEVHDRLSEIERRLEIKPREGPAAKLDDLARLTRDTDFAVAEDDLIHSIATDRVSLDLARLGALYPDHVVFLGVECPVITPSSSSLDVRGIGEYADDSLFVLVEGTGVVVRRDVSTGALAMLRCWADVLARIPAKMTVNTLSLENCGELLGWDAEHYRQRLAEGTGI